MCHARLKRDPGRAGNRRRRNPGDAGNRRLNAHARLALPLAPGLWAGPLSSITSSGMLHGEQLPPIRNALELVHAAVGEAELLDHVQQGVGVTEVRQVVAAGKLGAPGIRDQLHSPRTDSRSNSPLPTRCTISVRAWIAGKTGPRSNFAARAAWPSPRSASTTTAPTAGTKTGTAYPQRETAPGAAPAGLTPALFHGGGKCLHRHGDREPDVSGALSPTLTGSRAERQGEGRAQDGWPRTSRRWPLPRPTQRPRPRPDPAASMTAAMSSARCSSVGLPATRSESSVPRLSNRISRPSPPAGPGTGQIPEAPTSPQDATPTPGRTPGQTRPREPVT